jgi:hypothetical protein
MLLLTILEYIVESKATAQQTIGRTELRHRRSAILHKLGPSRTPLAGNASRCSLLLTVFLSLLSSVCGDYMRACIEVSGHRQSPGDDCRLKRVSGELSSFVEAWCLSLSLAEHAVSSTDRNTSNTQNKESTCSNYF